MHIPCHVNITQSTTRPCRVMTRAREHKSAPCAKHASTQEPNLHHHALGADGTCVPNLSRVHICCPPGKRSPWTRHHPCAPTPPARSDPTCCTMYPATKTYQPGVPPNLSTRVSTACTSRVYVTGFHMEISQNELWHFINRFHPQDRHAPWQQDAEHMWTVHCSVGAQKDGRGGRRRQL